MINTNDITGDRIISKNKSSLYQENYDKIFRNSKQEDMSKLTEIEYISDNSILKNLDSDDLSHWEKEHTN